MINKLTTEADLAARVVAQLRERGWTVYQEVCHLGNRADIVAVKDDRVGVYECKMSFNISVLQQAHRWINHADEVFVVVPAQTKKNGQCMAFRETLCHGVGIGCYHVYGSPNITPSIARCPDNQRGEYAAEFRSSLLKALNPAQCDYAPAGTSGKYWTPFKQFSAKVSALVKQTGQITLQAASDHPDLQGHYRSKATLRRCLPSLAQRGVFEGVHAYKLKNVWYLDRVN